MFNNKFLVKVNKGVLSLMVQTNRIIQNTHRHLRLPGMTNWTGPGKHGNVMLNCLPPFGYYESLRCSYTFTEMRKFTQNER